MYAKDYVTAQEVEQARRWGIFAYLERCEPEMLVRKGSSRYELRGHDSFVISPNGKWRWFSHGFGGNNAIDYLVKVRGMSFQEAVRELNSISGTPPPLPLSVKEERPPFILPKKNENDLAVSRYLLKRGIRGDLIGACIQAGLVYESKVYHNAVFVGFDKTKTPRYATLRGIYNCSIKMDVAGSDKRYAFSIPSTNPSAKLAVFESAIDLLSWKSYNPRNADSHLVSLGGVDGGEHNSGSYKFPLALERYLADYPEVHEVYLCLDADRAGRIATKKISEILRSSYKTVDCPPPMGKDYNDFLLLTQRQCLGEER